MTEQRDGRCWSGRSSGRSGTPWVGSFNDQNVGSSDYQINKRSWRSSDQSVGQSVDHLVGQSMDHLTVGPDDLVGRCVDDLTVGPLANHWTIGSVHSWDDQKVGRAEQLALDDQPSVP